MLGPVGSQLQAADYLSHRLAIYKETRRGNKSYYSHRVATLNWETDTNQWAATAMTRALLRPLATACPILPTGWAFSGSAIASRRLSDVTERYSACAKWVCLPLWMINHASTIHFLYWRSSLECCHCTDMGSISLPNGPAYTSLVHAQNKCRNKPQASMCVSLLCFLV